MGQCESGRLLPPVPESLLKMIRANLPEATYSMQQHCWLINGSQFKRKKKTALRLIGKQITGHILAKYNAIKVGLFAQLTS